MQEMLPAQAASAWVSEVHALVPNVNRATLESFVSPKLTVHSYSQTRGSPVGLARLAVATMRLLLRVRPDILHVHATVAGLVARLCAGVLWPRPKIVYCPHGWLFNQNGVSRRSKPVIRMVERLLGRVSDAIVCVSEHERRCAVSAGLPAGKCILVRNGVSDFPGPLPADECPHVTEGRLRVLYVGRFDIDKGFDTYLEAMRRLGNAAEGYAVGAYVTDKQKQPAIPQNVIVRGWCDRDALRTIYEQSSVLVVPSRAEAFGLVALEAMRSGLPVFCTRTGGLPELVLDGVTGRCFDADDVDGLLALLRGTSPAALRRYGREGRVRFVQHFTAGIMNRNMLEQYFELIAHGAAKELSSPTGSAATGAM